MDFRTIIKEYAEAPISRHLILELLSNYKRPNDKISELLKSEELISIRRGLYIIGPKMNLPSPEPFLIANHLRGPSYVSLESALSYWNMIPEKAYEISSVTIKTPKLYKTLVGRFTYQQLKTPYYTYGIKNIEYSPKQAILIASREKALCDKIVLTPKINLRSIKQTQEFLMEDLRIDSELLSTLDTKVMEMWIENAPKKNSLKMLVKTLMKL
ncbi:type IV toxin-antitoxin system AbiEi family antitoxin domain-containing protein [Mangrovimonas cancribranchiae]|uniref:Transcriptional regulator, AbiEi antitoxin, Type IV TA system n=1 Tax=Mangrovimonas cancribranchiae TaxID=3080055 RepID=A0AAU6P4L1_9FLAO